VHPIPAIILISGGSAILAVVGFAIVSKVGKTVDLGEHQGFLDAMLSIVGTLVSILLGLLVAAALDHYQSLEQSVDTEANCVSQCYRLSRGLPAESQRKIQSLCYEYTHLVLTEDWPNMAKRRRSPGVLKTYVNLVDAVVTFHPSTNGETNLHASLLNSVQQMGDCRRQRVLALDSPWTSHLFPVLIMCSLIVLVFAYIYMRKGALLHAALIFLVAIALGGNLGLVFLLSNPFSGDWQIQPRGFELNERILKEMQTSGIPIETSGAPSRSPSPSPVPDRAP
jgi:hypothetical protein